MRLGKKLGLAIVLGAGLASQIAVADKYRVIYIAPHAQQRR